MKRFAMSVLFFLSVSCFSANPAFAETDQILVEKVLKQLESSGAIDKAVQKSLERIKLKEIAAQKAEEEKIVIDFSNILKKREK
jgi:hypothetical protein